MPGHPDDQGVEHLDTSTSGHSDPWTAWWLSVLMSVRCDLQTLTGLSIQRAEWLNGLVAQYFEPQTLQCSDSAMARRSNVSTSRDSDIEPPGQPGVERLGRPDGWTPRGLAAKSRPFFLLQTARHFDVWTLRSLDGLTVECPDV
jgi:hypothetical protein